MTPAVIEVRRIEQKELPLDELAAIFRIQEGDPEKVVERVSRADKKKVIDSIIDHMVKNHNSVTEERYQFVLWLYSIGSHHGNNYGFLRIHRMMIHFVALLLMMSVACAAPVTSTLQMRALHEIYNSTGGEQWDYGSIIWV